MLRSTTLKYACFAVTNCDQIHHAYNKLRLLSELMLLCHPGFSPTLGGARTFVRDANDSTGTPDLAFNS